jgi:hypothetical protein
MLRDMIGFGYFRGWKQMDTKEIVLVDNFSERFPGEAVERVVNINHNFSLYFEHKSGELFTLYCCPNFGLAFFIFIFYFIYSIYLLVTSPTGNGFKIAVVY